MTTHNKNCHMSQKEMQNIVNKWDEEAERVLDIPPQDKCCLMKPVYDWEEWIDEHTKDGNIHFSSTSDGRAVLKDFIRKVKATAYAQGEQDMLERAKEKMKHFDRDFREYINASIRYAEVQTPYKPLDFEDEMKWLKNYFLNIFK